METRACCLTLAITMCAAGAACKSDSSSGSSPTAPGTGGGGTTSSCRTYATAANVTTTTQGLTQTAALTGAFNASTNQGTITVLFTGGALCSTAIHTYRSTADFVDEVRVVPPVPLVLSTTTTNSGTCGTGTGTVTSTYDAQRRLVTQVTSLGGTTTYTAWDASSRPTTGTMSSGVTIANVYNDGARTLTQTQTGGGQGTTVSTITFDASGNQIMIVNVTSGITATTTFANTSTAQVCK